MSLVRLPALQGFHMIHELNGMSMELPGLQSRANIKAALFVRPVLEVWASVSFPKSDFNGVTAFAQGIAGCEFLFYCCCKICLPLLKFKIVQSQLVKTSPCKTLLTQKISIIKADLIVWIIIPCMSRNMQD